MKKTLLAIGLFSCMHTFGQLPPYVPTTDLRAFFPFEGNLQNANMAQAGMYNLSALFPGNDISNYYTGHSANSQAIDISSSSAYKSDYLSQNLTNFTVGAWVKLSAYPDNYHLFSTIASDLMFTYDYQQNLVGTAGFFTLRVNEQGIVQGVLIGGGQSPVYSVATSTTQIALDTWYHIALAADFSNQTLKLYINGETDGEVTGSLVIPNPATKFVPGFVQRMEQDMQGNIFGTVAQPWGGKIDELAFYQRALTSCDIKALAQLLPEIDPVIAENNDHTSLFTTDSPDLTYQWYDCTTNQAISGATSATYSPTDNSEYYVVVSNSCDADTSACMALTPSTNALSEMENAHVQLFPNPATDFCTVQGINVATLELTELHGRTVSSQTGNTLSLSGIRNGVYYLHIQTTTGSVILRKLIVQH